MYVCVYLVGYLVFIYMSYEGTYTHNVHVNKYIIEYIINYIHVLYKYSVCYHGNQGVYFCMYMYM